MNDQRPRMFVPALIGGITAGVLSGIPIVNCLCCLGIIGGGILAAYFLTKESSVTLTAGDGAIVGVFTGIIAAFVEVFVEIPFRAMNEKLIQGMIDRFSQFYEEMPSGWESWLEDGGMEGSIVWTILGLVVSAVIFSALGALGGIIGISLFAKKKAVQKTEGVGNAPEDTSDRQP
ncbi:MAG: hypothetical protein JSV17_07405 [Candidatus Aminicenantes bacterium]|nr:MAG: hypothetical protein JSV17_07405 [Candidatus Aminicenantes bacterium]